MLSGPRYYIYIGNGGKKRCCKLSLGKRRRGVAIVKKWGGQNILVLCIVRGLFIPFFSWTPCASANSMQRASMLNQKGQ